MIELEFKSEMYFYYADAVTFMYSALCCDLVFPISNLASKKQLHYLLILHRNIMYFVDGCCNMNIIKELCKRVGSTLQM